MFNNFENKIAKTLKQSNKNHHRDAWLWYPVKTSTSYDENLA